LICNAKDNHGEQTKVVERVIEKRYIQDNFLHREQSFIFQLKVKVGKSVIEHSKLLIYYILLIPFPFV